jgi:hypothetical protein
MIVKPDRHAVLVLGMHRSGTSAVTRVINLLGAEIGRDLMPAAEGNNSRGFWEHCGVVKIHEELLVALGCNWHGTRPLPADWLSTAAAKAARAKLVDVLQRDFSGTQLWVVKDPRLCRLMPLWQLVLEDLNVRAHAVFVVRHPDEVGRSLLVRDGIPIAHTRLLWLQHLVEAEKATRGMSRVVVSYDDLLRDWRRNMVRVESGLSLRWPTDSTDAHSSIDQFLTPTERHHKLDASSDEGFPALLRSAYQAFVAAAKVDEDWGGLKRVSELYSINAGIFLDDIAILDDRARAAEEQWRLAAASVTDTEAALSDARVEWGRTAERLRESEAKQQHATEQWQATVAALSEAEVEWGRTADLWRESEAKQLYATEQWHAAAEMARVANDQLGQARNERDGLARDRDSLQLRVDVLERRQRWVIRGGIFAVLVAVVAVFCFRMI